MGQQKNLKLFIMLVFFIFGSILLFLSVLDEETLEFVHTGVVKDIAYSPSKISDDGIVLEYCADIVFEDGYRPYGICYDYAISKGYTSRNIGKNCTLYRVYDRDGWCAIGYMLKCQENKNKK